jgi:hypothetical protein
MESSVAMVERPPEIEAPTPRKDAINAVNEIAWDLRLEAMIYEDRLRRGVSLTSDEKQIVSDWHIFSEGRKRVLGADKSLPEDLKSETFTDEFENIDDPNGLHFRVPIGIRIDPLLRYLDRSIERRRAMPSGVTPVERFEELRDILIKNSKTFDEIYGNNLTEDQKRSFKKSFIREEAYKMYKNPLRQRGDDLGNWTGAEEDIRADYREFTPVYELEEQAPLEVPETTTNLPDSPPLESEYIEILTNRGPIKLKRLPKGEGSSLEESSPLKSPEVETADTTKTWEAKKPEEVKTGANSEKPQFRRRDIESIIPPIKERPSEPKRSDSMIIDMEGYPKREDSQVKQTVDRLMEMRFSKKIVNKRFALLLLPLILAALVQGERLNRPGQPITDAVSQPPLPEASLPLGGFRGKGPETVVMNFGEAGNSLHGFAVTAGAELDNQYLVDDAHKKGEEYPLNWGEEAKNYEGGILPPDHPVVVHSVRKAEEEVPWWEQFIRKVKSSIMEYNPDDIEGDALSKQVRMQKPSDLWKIAEQEHLEKIDNGS